jgi:glycosyltransferase involved in cell wall biosynthesis
MPNKNSRIKNTKPLVSIIMTVYNAEEYIQTSIDSIINQTFTDFEFIIIDDGSNDKSSDIIKSIKDPRIIFRSRKNKGQTESLNEGIRIAKGIYIARQDADDISTKNRLKLQIELMETDKNIGLLGTNYEIVYPDGKLWFTTNMFTHPDDLNLAIIFSNQFGHGSIVARR